MCGVRVPVCACVHECVGLFAELTDCGRDRSSCKWVSKLFITVITIPATIIFIVWSRGRVRGTVSIGEAIESFNKTFKIIKLNCTQIVCGTSVV